LNCDQETGQCVCLQNVVGKQCNLCQDDHYGLRNSETQGCTYCNCDIEGTVNNSTYCDTETGQCHCQHTRAGGRCSDCQLNHWGDPKVKDSCQCNFKLLFNFVSKI
jgi:hypothetical protein